MNEVEYFEVKDKKIHLLLKNLTRIQYRVTLIDPSYIMKDDDNKIGISKTLLNKIYREFDENYNVLNMLLGVENLYSDIASKFQLPIDLIRVIIEDRK